MIILIHGLTPTRDIPRVPAIIVFDELLLSALHETEQTGGEFPTRLAERRAIHGQPSFDFSSLLFVSGRIVSDASLFENRNPRRVSVARKVTEGVPVFIDKICPYSLPWGDGGGFSILRVLCTTYLTRR